MQSSWRRCCTRPCRHQLGLTTSLSAVVAANIAMASLLALRWHCLPHCMGIFAGHHSSHGIFVIPGLVVIDCVGRSCCLWQSMPASRWRLCRHCAGVVSLIVLASLCGIKFVAVSLLYPALSSSTGSANVVVCGGCRQHRAGVFAGIVLASSSSLCCHLCATS